MKATEVLINEHNGVKTILEVLSKINSQIKKGQEANLEHIDEIIEFLRVFVDQCHHTKEEVILFSSVESVGQDEDRALIKELLEEHNKGRSFVNSFSEIFDDYKKGNKEKASELVKISEEYISLLTKHIEKEDNKLFPVADLLLSKEEQKDMLEEFEDVEKDVVGLGQHEEFHLLIDELRKIYC